jgi:hypothetical protein
MKKNIFILLLIFFFNISVALFSYRAMTCYGGESNIVTILDLDSEGNLSIYETIPTEDQTDDIIMASDGKSAFPYLGDISIFEIDKNQNIIYLGGSPVMYACANATISYDNKYIVTADSVETNLKLLRIENDLSLTYTGSYIDLDLDEGLVYMAFSKFNNTILGGCFKSKEIAVLRLLENEQLIDTEQRLSTDPYRNNIYIIITPNGRFCYTSGSAPYGVVCCEILPDGEVLYKGPVITGKWGTNFRVTSDSRFLIMIDLTDLYNGILRSYRIEDDGSLTEIDSIGNLPLLQTLDITPDNKYVLIAWDYRAATQQVSVIRLYNDGTLEKLDKDQTIPGAFSDIRFIPPYVTATDDAIWEMYE